MAERLGVALLLQLEARLVDAAGGIDRQHELQIDLGLRAGFTAANGPMPTTSAASAQSRRRTETRAMRASSISAGAEMQPGRPA